MTHRSLARAFALAAAAITAGVAPAALAMVPTLSGETLTATSVHATSTCNPGGTSTIEFTVSGLAAGPYPGTFVETGTATLPPGVGTVATATFQASFTIQSPLGEITGTKELFVSPVFFPGSFCTNFGPIGPIFSVHNLASYDATIKTLTGTFLDSGVSDVIVVDIPQNPQHEFFSETFVSDLAEPVPAPPDTTPGQTTGGGKTLKPIGGPGGVTFGLFAKSDERGILATCNVIDGDVQVRCLDAGTYVQTGNEAEFSGNATVDGVPTTYTIHVVDNGETGIGQDTFSIVTTSGFAASGVLTQGNVQVHRATT